MGLRLDQWTDGIVEWSLTKDEALSIFRERADLHVDENVDFRTNIRELVATLQERNLENGVGVETTGPNVIFITNRPISITNSSTSLLFFWIERTFGGF